MTNKKILYWLRKAQRVTSQIRTDVDDDDDDGMYLTTACYTMEDQRKDYEDTNWIILSHNMVQWWAVVVGDEPAVRKSYSTEL